MILVVTGGAGFIGSNFLYAERISELSNCMPRFFNLCWKSVNADPNHE